LGNGLGSSSRWNGGLTIHLLSKYGEGLSLHSITGEITYGLERLAMYIQNVDNVYDLKWNAELTYGGHLPSK